MRVAVLSDIHANAFALEAVLEALAPYDRVWVLGDTVGYGPHPDRVAERLREEGALAVAGNHDAAALGRLPVTDFNDHARMAVGWTMDAISAGTRAWLAGLPEKHREGDFTLAHGSPRDPYWEYLDSIAAARLNMAAFATPYCLVGHTHRPLAFRDDRGRIEVLRARAGGRLMLDERRSILNPGSVGQPRDGDARASAMLLDTDRNEVEWRRVAYPVELTQEAIRARPLPSILADRLALGR
jgi:diadenosine tetraphosphatase ApaH/serine/threonine PP2A family protein phosphatase